jgi:hypothetical protein
MATIDFTMLGALGAVSTPIPSSGTLLYGGPTSYTIYFDGQLNLGEDFTLANTGDPESSGIPVTYLGTDNDGGVYLSTGQYVYLVTNAAIATGDPYQYEAIDYLCFLAGTLIQTGQGEVPVETLRAGDLVLVRRRGTIRLEPLLWVGRTQARVTTGQDARKAAPVHIAAGALDRNMPARDLRVSPEHALLVDGVLVPAGLLVNGITITQPLHCQDITYYHLELVAHGLLLSDGAWSESYRDDGNRHLFNNASILNTAGTFEGAGTHGVPEVAACLPIVRDGPALGRLRLLVARRGEDLAQATASRDSHPAAPDTGTALPVYRRGRRTPLEG